jgi:probable HAF family extracellular repeat protein
MPTYTYTTLDHPAGNGGTLAYGINDGGQISGTYTHVFLVGRTPQSSAHGFLYAGGAYTTLDDPSAVASPGTSAYGINNVGQVVGRYLSDTGFHGFLYSGGHYINIDHPSASLTFAQGINASGQIVGYYDSSAGGHGFLYSGGTYTNLDDPSAAGATNPLGINASTQIVGEYVDSGGTAHGSSTTAARTPHSPIPLRSMAMATTPTAPLLLASTMRARSSAIITVTGPLSAPPRPDTASSTVAAYILPSTIRRQAF